MQPCVLQSSLETVGDETVFSDDKRCIEGPCAHCPRRVVFQLAVLQQPFPEPQKILITMSYLDLPCLFKGYNSVFPHWAKIWLVHLFKREMYLAAFFRICVRLLNDYCGASVNRCFQ